MTRRHQQARASRDGTTHGLRVARCYIFVSRRAHHHVSPPFPYKYAVLASSSSILHARHTRAHKAGVRAQRRRRRPEASSASLLMASRGGRGGALREGVYSPYLDDDDDDGNFHRPRIKKSLSSNKASSSVPGKRKTTTTTRATLLKAATLKTREKREALDDITRARERVLTWNSGDTDNAAQKSGGHHADADAGAGEMGASAGGDDDDDDYEQVAVQEHQQQPPRRHHATMKDMASALRTTLHLRELVSPAHQLQLGHAAAAAAAAAAAGAAAGAAAAGAAAAAGRGDNAITTRGGRRGGGIPGGAVSVHPQHVFALILRICPRYNT